MNTEFARQIEEQLQQALGLISSTRPPRNEEAFNALERLVTEAQAIAEQLAAGNTEVHSRIQQAIAALDG